MTEQHKTHYRKAFDSPYLSAADIVDPVILTIRAVKLEKDKTKKTSDEFNTAHWVEREIRHGEPLKPMILNATNSKFLADMTGSKFIDDWAGTNVTVWVDNNVRFGKETVEGLRLAKTDAEANRIGRLTDDLIAGVELLNTEADCSAYWKANNAKLARWPNAHAEFKQAYAARYKAVRTPPTIDAPKTDTETDGAPA